MAPRRGLHRDGITLAAGELADEVGLENLSLSVLASKLGVRTPSLYNHIDGVDALRRELCRLGLRELNQRLQRAGLGIAGDEAVVSMLRAYRSFAKERPGVYQATLRAPAPDDEATTAAAEVIIDTVMTVLTPYHLSPDDSVHVIRGFRALGHGFASLEVANGFGMPIDLDASYERLVAAFLIGLNRLSASASE